MGNSPIGTAFIVILAFFVILFVIILILLITKPQRKAKNKMYETTEDKYYRTRNIQAEAEEKEYYKTHYTEDYIKALIRFFIDKTNGIKALNSLNINEFIGKVFSPFYLINFADNVPSNAFEKNEMFSVGVSSARKETHGFTFDNKWWIDLYWSIAQEDIDFYESYKASKPNKIAEYEKELTETYHELKERHIRNINQHAEEQQRRANLAKQGIPYIEHYSENTGDAKLDKINAEYNAKMRQAVSNLASSDPKAPKSAAGSMVKGAAVGGALAGPAGAVVGAMVGKEKHDSKNK